MADKLTFRPLNADEVEARPQSEYPNGIIVLLYKNARCDMGILDETVGPENWQRRHYDCKGNLFCSVGIRCGDEWVWKDDAGAESNMDKQKGEASDSFKRACTNWGIGRALYTAPFIWIKAGDYETKERNKKQVFNDRLTVDAIDYADGKICALQISNKKGDIAYTFGKVAKASGSTKKGAPICPVCHHSAQAAKGPSGPLTPHQVLEQFGMCVPCWQEKQREENPA